MSIGYSSEVIHTLKVDDDDVAKIFAYCVPFGIWVPV